MALRCSLYHCSPYRGAASLLGNHPSASLSAVHYKYRVRRIAGVSAFLLAAYYR